MFPGIGEQTQGQSSDSFVPGNSGGTLLTPLLFGGQNIAIFQMLSSHAEALSGSQKFHQIRWSSKRLFPRLHCNDLNFPVLLSF